MSMAEEQFPAYHEFFASLTDIVLEESWVLDLDASLCQLIVRLDLVLTPAHPHYRPPRSDEAFCYRRGALVVDRLRSDVAERLHPLAELALGDALQVIDHPRFVFGRDVLHHTTRSPIFRQFISACGRGSIIGRRLELAALAPPRRRLGRESLIDPPDQ